MERTRSQQRNLKRDRKRWDPHKASLFAAVAREEGRRKKHFENSIPRPPRGVTWRAECPHLLPHLDKVWTAACYPLVLVQNGHTGHALCAAEAQLGSSHIWAASVA